MAAFTESFFDDPNTEGFNLWSKVPEDYQPADEPVLHKGGLFKFSKAKNSWKQRHFVLTEKHLLYYKADPKESDQKVREVIKLHFVRNEYIVDGHPTNPEFRYGIKFFKNLKYSELWTKDEEDLRQWQAALSKVCIQSDFHSKFSALKMIGKGSFARVYLVEHQTTKEHYAVKAFSKEYLLSQKKGKDSLLNEIEIMKQLDHENLMRLYEIHESQNSIYLILELLEGGELLDYISKMKGKIKLVEYKHIIRSILRALKYMSGKNIMHRDLKPENMILKIKGGPIEQNVLKIVDFGLATNCDLQEYLFKRCGTPGFVAPEVVNASSEDNIHYSPKCDIFSAGVIFYLMYPCVTADFQERVHSLHNKECKIDFKIEELKHSPPEGEPNLPQPLIS